MDKERSIEIIDALAAGTDPTTGEVFASDHVMQNADVVRALYDASIALREQVSKSEKSKTLPTRAGAPWTSKENEELVAGHRSGLTESELAGLHQRTRGAIQRRLLRLGIITNQLP
ncbi:MAG: hypothetical protein ABIV13_02215 [Fimbriimonadales bacterium]